MPSLSEACTCSRSGTTFVFVGQVKSSKQLPPLANLVHLICDLPVWQSLHTTVIMPWKIGEGLAAGWPCLPHGSNIAHLESLMANLLSLTCYCVLMQGCFSKSRHYWKMASCALDQTPMTFTRHWSHLDASRSSGDQGDLAGLYALS